MAHFASSVSRHQAACLATQHIGTRPASLCTRLTAPGTHSTTHARRVSGSPPPAAVPSDVEQQEIENINRDYCDDFVCTSSPAIEATVRSLARDILRANGVWTRSLLSRTVQYNDPFRRFKGADGYSRLDFVPKYIKSPRVSITSMKMIDTGAAEILWRVGGDVGPFGVEADMTTRIEMNLLTGQIEKHEESWNLSRCSPPSAIAWTAARALWAAKSSGAEAAEATNSMLDSLTSVDEDDGFTTTRSPNDPMKFFQQRDSFKDDAYTYIGLLLLFYIMTMAWGQLFKG
jgi:hypothetical protein